MAALDVSKSANDSNGSPLVPDTPIFGPPFGFNGDNLHYLNKGFDCVTTELEAEDGQTSKFKQLCQRVSSISQNNINNQREEKPHKSMLNLHIKEDVSKRDREISKPGLIRNMSRKSSKSQNDLTELLQNNQRVTSSLAINDLLDTLTLRDLPDHGLTKFARLKDLERPLSLDTGTKERAPPLPPRKNNYLNRKNDWPNKSMTDLTRHSLGMSKLNNENFKNEETIYHSPGHSHEGKGEEGTMPSHPDGSGRPDLVERKAPYERRHSSFTASKGGILGQLFKLNPVKRAKDKCRSLVVNSATSLNKESDAKANHVVQVRDIGMKNPRHLFSFRAHTDSLELQRTPVNRGKY